ncbi:MAG: DUF533 domain-containing protein [Planctomycetes bacterium]|nr:DUF533 domain-containing protein [Planctomycetota bacterium]
MSAIGFLGPLLSSALGARAKPHARAFGFLAGSRHSFLNSSNLLALGGLGWAAYEIWRTRERAAQASGGAPVVVPGTVVQGDLPPPLPPKAAKGVPPGPPAIQNDVQRIVELTLAAARCDGELGEEEFGALLRTARDIGAERMVKDALEHPRPVAEIVGGVSDRKQREALYVYAFSIVRADEDVRTGERAWLADLARQLGLEAATTTRLEKETAYRIASMPAGTQRA